MTGTNPAPADADTVTLEVVGSGLVALLPVRKSQVAIDTFNEQVGGTGVLFTVSVSVAVLPVLIVPMKRLPVVFVCVPTDDDVTCTVIVQVPFAATVPLLKLILVAPAVGANVGEPQPFVEIVAGEATVTPVGRGSVKL